MTLPKPITLLYVPTQTDAEAHISELTDKLIRSRMGNAWWDDRAVVPEAAAKEIDRHWDWAEQEIEREGRILSSRKLAVVTGDGAIQGAMLISTEAVACKREAGKPALFVELLFAAPRNRYWIRQDKSEYFRGVGVGLLRAAGELSIEAGFAGRLKLESSPGFVDWYKKRGLLEVSKDRILHDGVAYTPMELEAERVAMLLPDREKEA